MAGIEGLVIRGVRAFHPDEEHHIKFFKPLTVIVGANGCGKTTIIECLKYLTTGALPPDSHSGQSFVHDPRMAGLTEVKAQIRLKFTDRTGKKVQCNRQFQLVVRPKSLKFQALDVTLVRKHPITKKSKSINKRCTDMDSLMPHLLGVSKAILTNVIFCHQEDSSWPIQEGAPLKKKLDEIFESTRYTKALQDLKVQKDKYKAEAKDLEADVRVLTEMSRQYDDLASSMSDAQAKDRSLAVTVEELEARLAEAEEEADKYSRLQQALGDLVRKLEVDKQRLADKHVEFEQLLASVQQRIDMPDEELDRHIEQYGDAIANAERQVEQGERKVQALAARIDSVREQHAQLRTEEGKLQQKAEQQQQSLDEFNQLASGVAEQFGVSSWRELRKWDDAAVTRLTSQFKQLEQARQRDLKAARKTMRVEMNKLDKAASRAMVDLNRIDMQIKTAQADRRSTELQLGETGEKIRRLPNTSAARDKLADLETRIAHKNAELKSLKTQPRVASVERKLEKLTVQMRKTRGEQDSLRSASATIRRQDTQRALLQEKVDAHEQQVEHLRRETARLQPAFSAVLGRELDPAMVVDDLDGARERRAGGLAEAEAKLRKAEQELSGVAGQLRGATTRAKAAEASQARLRRSEGYATLEQHATRLGCEVPDVLERVQQEKESAQRSTELRKAMLAAMKFLRDEVLEASGHKKHASCPLCLSKLTRHGDRASIDAIVQEVERRSQGVSTSNKGPSTRLKQIQAAFKLVQKAQPTIAKLAAAVDELARCRESIAALTQERERHAAAVAQAQEEVQAARQSKDAADALVADAHSLHQLHRAAAAAEAEIANLRSALDAATSAGVDASMTMEEVERRLQDLDATRDKLAQEQNKLEKQLAEEHRKENTCRASITALKDEMLSVKQQLETHTNLTQQQQRLEASLQRHQACEDKLKKQVPAMRAAHEAAEDAKRAGQARYHAEEETASAALAAVTQASREVSTAGARLQRLMLTDVQNQLATVQLRSAEFVEETNGLNNEVEQARNMVTSSRETVASQERLFRSLLDEKKVRTVDADISSLEASIAAAEKEIQERSGGSLDADAVNAAKQVETVRMELASVGGRRREVATNIATLRESMAEKKFKSIHDRMRMAMIKFETTKLAVEDLEIYHKALDKALMRYHTMKIQEINTSIRTLWAHTYRGGDIDTIEIRSDLDAGKTSRGRTYNYRVVMKKGTTELDMKGRCSAGQKVLASLIIRLALAETFCVTCGVLALDEPTTNLDEANKAGFAAALAQLIAARSEQRNFQLIMITHDQSFVDALSSELSKRRCGIDTPHYYRLGRLSLDGGLTYRSRIYQQEWNVQ